MGLAAGALILAVGAFVLIARPASTLHRFFFVLALVDGLSTALFQLAGMSDGLLDRVFWSGLYWYYQIAFVTLLIAFGLVFPRPLRSEATARAAVGVAVALGALAMVLYVLDHGAFWRVIPPPNAYGFGNVTGGTLVMTAFVAGSALLVAKLTWEILKGPSESFVRQAAFVLGGMTLAYAPYATTNLLRAALTDLRATLFSPAPVVAFAYWTFVAYALVLLATAVLLFRGRREETRDARRLVLASLGGVLFITVVSVAAPGASLTYLVQRLGLLAYPVLLGYAIVRYEVFDINARIRRAATVSLVASALGGFFIIAETAIENVLQEGLLGVVSSSFASNAIAAGLAGLVWLPVSRSIQGFTRKIVPDLPADELHKRKLEIYQHSLEGALADGILQEKESRTLIALRESLGISQAEHDRVFADVSRRLVARTPS